jgi:hypothetical protein
MTNKTAASNLFVAGRGVAAAPGAIVTVSQFNNVSYEYAQQSWFLDDPSLSTPLRSWTINSNAQVQAAIDTRTGE